MKAGLFIGDCKVKRN